LKWDFNWFVVGRDWLRYGAEARDDLLLLR
jgi:hypothetical protein